MRLFRRCSLLVCNGSAIARIAVSLGINTAVFFGSDFHQGYRLLNRDSFIFYKNAIRSSCEAYLSILGCMVNDLFKGNIIGKMIPAVCTESGPLFNLNSP
jgi:hypothetical protein